MYIRQTTKNMTTNDIISILKQNNYDIVHDEKRNLYIAYNKHYLLAETGLMIDSVSIANLKAFYNGDPNEKQEGSNCTNKEALNRIGKLEKVINSIITNPNIANIFEYLPYTKENKFAKSGAINLFIPNIKSTWSGEYFSQNEVALQLRPIAIEPAGSFTFNVTHSNEIVVMEINGQASFTTKKAPENIIDENGNFCNVDAPKRNSYLKRDTLVRGTSYTDAKGSEYLYLGRMDYYFLNIETGRPLYGYKTQYSSCYLRITSKIKTELTKYTTLQDFLQARFAQDVKSGFNDGHFDTDPYRGLNVTESKKFVSTNTVYYDENHNNLTDMIIQKQCYYDDKLKTGVDSHDVDTIKIKFQK